MVSITALTLFPAIALATYVVPLPAGPYGVSITDALVTDHSLHDPYLNLTYRRVPISIISPTGSSGDCELVEQPYMPNLTAAFWEKELYTDFGLPLNNTLVQTQLTLCRPTPLNYSTPVVLLASGASISRYLYNILGVSLAAQTGYTVITYDVPGITGIVQFPDGSVQYQFNKTVGSTVTNEYAVTLDMQDGLVALDAIFTHAIPAQTDNYTVTPALPRSLQNVTQAGFLGHSQGGAAAYAGTIADDRILAGVNMDGGLNITADTVAICTALGNAADCSAATTSKPFMFTQRQNNSQASADGWAQAWADVLRGPKWQVGLNGSAHATYGDYPYLVDLYGVRAKSGVSAKLVDEVVGSTPGAEAIEVLAALFKAFLGYAFGGATAQGAGALAGTIADLAGLGLETFNQTIV